jgi:hypothetical protein
MPSVLTDAPFVKTTLTYTLQGAAGSPDAFGNPTYATSTGTVSAFVSAAKIDALQRLEGADAQIVRAQGELDNPLTFPAGVGVGSVLTLTYAGRACTLTLTNVIPNDIVGVRFGTFFQGDLKVV